jgi:hypothetical protein
MLLSWEKLQSTFPKDAYGYGYAEESLRGIIQDNREVKLVIKLNPAVIGTGSVDDRFLQFRLEGLDGAAIPHTTYNITVAKVNNTTEGSEELQLHEKFHSHIGVLTLNVRQLQDSANSHGQGLVNVIGAKDPSLDSWVADSSGNLTVEGPIISQAGVYHVHVEILGIEHDNNEGDSPQYARPPAFDAWLSLGDVLSTELYYDSQRYNVTVISYSDKIMDFGIVDNQMTLSWITPFDWNQTLSGTQHVLVHQEAIIPRSFIKALNSTSFGGTVNEQALNRQAIVVDPYSLTENYLIHFVITKETLEKLAKNRYDQVADSEGPLAAGDALKNILSFRLMMNSSSKETYSYSPYHIQISSGDSPVIVLVDFSSGQLASDSQPILTMKFYEQVGTRSLPISGDVYYGLSLLDKDKKLIVSKENLIAKDGIDAQGIPSLPEGTYEITVNATALKRPSNDNVDESYSGLLTAKLKIALVPEFPFVSLIMAGAIGSVITVTIIASRFEIGTKDGQLR